MIDWNEVSPVGLIVFMTAGILLMVFPRFVMAPLLKVFRSVKPVIMKPVEEELPDWSKAPKNAKYVAQDVTGEWRWHSTKPKFTPEGYWVSSTPMVFRAGFTVPSSEDFITLCSKSLQKRP